MSVDNAAEHSIGNTVEFIERPRPTDFTVLSPNFDTEGTDVLFDQLEEFPYEVTDGLHTLFGQDRDSQRRSVVQALAEGLVRTTNVAIGCEADTMIFLDKSARPVSRMFLEYWKLKYPAFKPPQVKFLDIGAKNRHEAEIGATLPKGALEIREKFGDLSGHNILVVDEAIRFGHTLRAARGLIKELYPDNEVVVSAFSDKLTPYWFYDKRGIGIEDSAEGSFFAEEPEKEIQEEPSNIRKALEKLARMGGIDVKRPELESRKVPRGFRSALKRFAQVVASYSNYESDVSKVNTEPVVGVYYTDKEISDLNS